MTFSCYSYEVIRNLNCRFNFREELTIFLKFHKNWGILSPQSPPLSTPLSIAIAGKELSLSSWCIASLYIDDRMRSQPQLRNDKYIMTQYTNWINSNPSQQ